jgi:hypothetical protein
MGKKGGKKNKKPKESKPICRVTKSKFNYSSAGFSELQEQLSNGTVY